MSSWADLENETLDSVGVIASSASRILPPEEIEEHPMRREARTHRGACRRRAFVSVIMAVFERIALNSARIFG
jgi:hypothetical protein